MNAPIKPELRKIAERIHQAQHPSVYEAALQELADGEARATQELRQNIDDTRIRYESASRSMNEARRERDAARAEVLKLQEQNGLQLAACDCAAIMDTPETHEKNKTVTRKNPSWSPAFESVMRRTAECIQLRAEVERLTFAHRCEADDVTKQCDRAEVNNWIHLNSEQMKAGLREAEERARLEAVAYRLKETIDKTEELLGGLKQGEGYWDMVRRVVERAARAEKAEAELAALKQSVDASYVQFPVRMTLEAYIQDAKTRDDLRAELATERARRAGLIPLLARWLKVADDCHREQLEVGHSEYNITAGLLGDTRAALAAREREATPRPPPTLRDLPASS